jgi:hypothetical protein
MGLLVSLLFAKRDQRRASKGTRMPPTAFWAGFWTTFAVWVLGLIASVASIDWVIANAHFIAAGGLLACILAVAVANAVRSGEHYAEACEAGEQSISGLRAAREALVRSPTGILRHPKRYRYTALAWLILVATLIGIVLVIANVITLFWLEIIVAFLFIAFWVVQTIEQLP